MAPTGPPRLPAAGVAASPAAETEGGLPPTTLVDDHPVALALDDPDASGGEEECSDAEEAAGGAPSPAPSPAAAVSPAAGPGPARTAKRPLKVSGAEAAARVARAKVDADNEAKRQWLAIIGGLPLERSGGGGLVPEGHRWTGAHRSHKLAATRGLLWCCRCGY